MSAAQDLRRRIEDSLEHGGVEIRTRGLAMRPLLEPGDRVRLIRREPRPGDVALVEIGQKLVFHRLIRQQGETWWVRGDSGPAPLGRVHADQILAIATERLRERDDRGRWRPLDPQQARSERLRAWLRHPLDRRSPSPGR